MHDNRPPTLIVGIGNILLADEGVGVRVVERLRSIPLPDTVELVDGGTAGADLIDILADRDKVIVIDAVDLGTTAGTLYRLTPEQIEASVDSLSLHQLGLAETLKMVKLMKKPLGEVIIFAVQIGSIEPSLNLTPSVSAVVESLILQILMEIEGLRIM